MSALRPLSGSNKKTSAPNTSVQSVFLLFIQIPSSPLPDASSCLHSKGSSLSSLALLLLCFHSPLSLWLPLLTLIHSAHPYTGLYKHTHTEFISTSVVVHLPMSVVPGWHTFLSHRQSTDFHTTTLPNLPVFPSFLHSPSLTAPQPVCLSLPAQFLIIFPPFNPFFFLLPNSAHLSVCPSFPQFSPADTRIPQCLSPLFPLPHFICLCLLHTQAHTCSLPHWEEAAAKNLLLTAALLGGKHMAGLVQASFCLSAPSHISPASSPALGKQMVE